MGLCVFYNNRKAVIMLKRLENFLISILTKGHFRGDHEIYVYLITLAAILFSFVGRIYFLCLYIYMGHTLLSTYNLITLAFYIFIIQAARRHHDTLAGLTLSLEVMLYALFTGIVIGIDNYLLGYYLMILSMQGTVPYTQTRIRLTVAVLTIMFTTASIIISGQAAPLAVLSDQFARILLISNIYLLLICTIVQLMIGNGLRYVITHYNHLRVEELENQAYTDPLTGIYNRRYADIFIKKIADTATGCYCVAMLDIDDFKLVNDQHGHAAGDTVLQFLANFLKKHLRKTDTVIRWGGEEFLIVLDVPSSEVAQTVMEKIRRLLADTDIPLDDGQTVRITVTVGLAELNCRHPFDSINECDQRLYVGKKHGKNNVILQ